MKIGTCIRGNEFSKDLSRIHGLGFDTIQLYFPGSLNGFKFEETEKVIEVLNESSLKMNSIGLYCNPIQDIHAREEIKLCLKNASKFNISVFSTFTGAIENGTVEDSLPLFKKYFTEFLEIAKDNNVKIAIENYPAFGFWYRTTANIGFCPRAWEMMFNEIDDPDLGLEWEPSHQIEQFINPVSQLEKWVDKVIHVHGKDCYINHELLKEVGILSCLDYASHCFPGFGDTDWKKIISILKNNGYDNSITIEGFHDSVYKEETEVEGQMLAFEYLKKCKVES